MNGKHKFGFALLWGLLVAGLCASVTAIGLTIFWERRGGPDGASIADGINFCIYTTEVGLVGFALGAWYGWIKARWPVIPWAVVAGLLFLALMTIPSRTWAENQWDESFKILSDDQTALYRRLGQLRRWMEGLDLIRPICLTAAVILAIIRFVGKPKAAK